MIKDAQIRGSLGFCLRRHGGRILAGKLDLREETEGPSRRASVALAPFFQIEGRSNDRHCNASGAGKGRKCGCGQSVPHVKMVTIRACDACPFRPPFRPFPPLRCLSFPLQVTAFPKQTDKGQRLSGETTWPERSKLGRVGEELFTSGAAQSIGLEGRGSARWWRRGYSRSSIGSDPPPSSDRTETHVSSEDCGTLISERLFGRYAGPLERNSRVNGGRPEKVPFRDATSPLQGQASTATMNARGTEMSKSTPREKNFGSSIGRRRLLGKRENDVRP